MEGVGLTPAFWRGRRVFLTGHTGFKGSWLALWLQALGAQVRGFALAPPSQPSLFELARVGEGMESLRGDIRDLAALQRALAAQRPEIVIHMAAQSLVRVSYRDPVETYQTNVLGTVHVLEAVRQAGGVQAVVVVTSDKCYENRERGEAYREDDPMGGHDPYSSSKGCAELVTSAYRRSYFSATDGAVARVASVRAGNVIGGGDWAAERLVPDVVRALGADAPLAVRNPEAVRPWQYVLEPLAGYLILAEALCREGATCAEAWNFGPDADDLRTVRELLERLARVWGRPLRWVPVAAPQPHEARLLMLDSRKARERLGWRPRTSLAQALEHTAAWYQSYWDGADLQEASLRALQRYAPAAPGPAPDA
jgi:CDP-glucose 4,6-dehydratase